MELARVILSVILALLLVVTGGGKVLDLPYSRGNLEALRVHPTFWRIIGVLELAAVVGLVWGIWFVPFGLAAAIGVVLLMLGAMGFRIRTRDAGIIRMAIADVVVLLMAGAVVVLSALAL